VDALGWTLLHFLWQGALAALALAALQTSCRRATPQTRYLLGALTLLAMLAAPMITYGTLRSQAPRAPHEAAAGSGTAAPFVVDVGTPGPRVEAPVLRERVEPILPALVGLWGSGVLLLSLRSLGGWALARRLTRAGLGAVPAEVENLLARLVQALRVSAPVRLFETALVEVPTVVGWLRPVVLLPASALAGLSMEQLELILAHELAHIRRRDYLVNLLQTAAETLLFYHPAVWWVSHRMRVEREHCCDDLAVAACGNALIYAHTLAELEERRSGTPALVMAASGGALLSRVARLLGAQQPRSRAARGLSAVAAPAGLAAALGTASLLLAGTSLTPPASEIGAEVAQAAEPRAFPLPRILEMARAGVTPEYIDELAALGYPSLTPDELIALSSQGVGPDYVRELAEQGYRELSPDQLMMLRSQGVSAEYAGELKAQGLGDLSVSALVELRSQGITPEYVAELKGAGYDGLSVSKLIGLRSQGVSGEFAAELKALGYQNLSVNRLIALRSNGITPEYVKELGSLGYREIDVPMLIGLRNQGVTPEFVRGLKEAGYPALSAGALIQLRAAGVSPEYVKELAQAGATGLSVEELIELRSNGVSPELVKRFQGRR
jgi:beta-lactamase regulating signal transducer with metallopeptidase domain